MKTCRYLLACLILPLCLCLGLATPAPASAPPAPGKTQHLTSPDQVPDGLAKSDWASIRAAYEAGRHAFQPVADGFQARNPGQQWLTRFDRRGFIAEPDAGGWQWGLELQSYGFPGQERALTGTPALQAEGTRLTYTWDATVQEWFINDTRGLEHGFTVKERPNFREGGRAAALQNAGAPLAAPSGFLNFRLAVRGNLTAQVATDGQAVSFHDAAGATALNYAGLKVWDADGKILSSRFEPVDPSHPSVVTLSVDERGARYPLTIDPIAQQAYLKPSTISLSISAGSYDFGNSVSVSGDTVVVGAPSESSTATGVNGNQNSNTALYSGAAYVFVRSGSTWTQQAYLKASNTEQWDRFGYSVAVSGNTIVVGAYGEDGNATGVNGSQNNNSTETGAAYVFVRSGTTWTQQAYLKASNTEANDQFGYAVAISGDTVVVGAVGEDSNATGVNGNQNDNSVSFAGAAYVFVRSGSTWTQQAYLKASNTDLFDGFGRSVAVSGDTVVVGARSEDSNATGVNGNQGNNSVLNSGAAYVFVRSGTTWSQQAYLKASNTGTNDYFGCSVAVAGDTAVVGAFGEASNATGINGNQGNDNATNSGAAYVFVRSGTTWTQQAYLKASNTEANDYFGWSVAVSGDTLVVGAGSEDSNAAGVDGNQSNNSITNSGAAYVFVRGGSTWTQQAYLKASNTGTSDDFGLSVAISDGTAVVAAPGEASLATGVNGNQNDNSEPNTGAAYIFAGIVAPTNNPPAVTTLAASATTASGATLNGSANPGNMTAIGFFQWGTSTSYGQTTTAAALGSGSSAVPFSRTLGGLVPGQTYHFRAAASNSAGIVYGADLTFTTPVTAPGAFTNVSISGLPGVFDGTVTWGDYDSDGRLDFLLTGDSGLFFVSQLWRNTGSGFTNVPLSGLPGVRQGSVAWGDYNNDGRLDFLVTGNAGETNLSQLWRNTGSGFTNIPIAGLPQVHYSSVAWGDYDNDGRLDFLLTGNTGSPNAGSTNITQLWRNTGTGFTPVPIPGVPAVDSGAVAWGDYNKDGRLDFFITGYTGSNFVSQLWRNTGGGFANVAIAGLPGVYASSVAWGDYNNDGRLDFLITGQTTNLSIAQLWQNTGSGFSNVPVAGLPGITGGAAAWGDYDNDGRLDFLLMGSGAALTSPLWRNTGSGFTNVPIAGLTGDQFGSVAWGDHDNDGRLDFFVAGSFFTGLWRNTSSANNTPPSAPTGLIAQVGTNSLTLRWLPSSDDHTPVNGLSYNLIVFGSYGDIDSCGRVDLASPMANSTNGFRRVVQLGGANLGTSWTFTNLARVSKFYWSVQAVDTSLAGGSFAPVQTVLNVAFSSITRPAAGQATLTFRGAAGQEPNYRIERSRDFVTWTHAGQPTESPAFSGRYTFTDSGAAGTPWFYRIVYIDPLCL